MDGETGSTADARGPCPRVWQRAQGTRLGSEETTADGFRVPKGELIEAWTQTSAQAGISRLLEQAKLNFQRSFRRENLIKFCKVIEITNKNFFV